MPWVDSPLFRSCRRVDRVKTFAVLSTRVHEKGRAIGADGRLRENFAFHWKRPLDSRTSNSRGQPAEESKEENFPSHELRFHVHSPLAHVAIWGPSRGVCVLRETCSLTRMTCMAFRPSVVGKQNSAGCACGAIKSLYRAARRLQCLRCRERAVLVATHQVVKARLLPMSCDKRPPLLCSSPHLRLCFANSLRSWTPPSTSAMSVCELYRIQPEEEIRASVFGFSSYRRTGKVRFSDCSCARASFLDF